MRFIFKKQFIIPLVAFGILLFLGLTIELKDRLLGESHITPRITVTIPEGSTVSDINKILISTGVFDGVELSRDLEGYLFPDTYEFFLGSSVAVVEKRFRERFEAKVIPAIGVVVDDAFVHEVLTVASLIEREVPDSYERRVVSGIIRKRIKLGIPLQIDASICYIKNYPCLPITRDDKNIDSPYNTYKYRGLPPGPINNPGLDAIGAALDPKESPYLYFLSDPKTNKTIFSRTLDEHNKNIVKYLK